MSLHFRSPIVLLSLTWASLSFAQGAGSKRSADDDWLKIVGPTSSPSGGVAPGGVQGKQSDAQVAAALKQTAQSAKDFQTSFPTDSRVGQAKKIEALSLVRAIRPTDSDHGQAAFQVAAAFRADTKNSTPDRFEVAATVERQQYSEQNGGRALAKDGAQHEKTADKLRAEFGDISEVYAFYLGVVNTADSDSALRVARKVIQLPSPPSAKAEAQVTVDRAGLVGKRMDTPLVTQDGSKLTLSQIGKTTIVFVWSGEAAAQFGVLTPYRKLAPADARWVYLGINARYGPMGVTRSKITAPGEYYYEPGGLEGPVMKALKIRQAPTVYVFDRTGVLTGYGRPTDLPVLLKQAAR